VHLAEATAVRGAILRICVTFFPGLSLKLTKGYFMAIMLRHENNKNPNKEDSGIMLEVTEKASEMIKDFLKDKEEIPAIRIMLSQGG
jgi:hypothetical protein